MKKRRKTPKTPDEREASLDLDRLLEERIARGQAELAAVNSVYARVPRPRLLDFAMARAAQA